jgi:hypothetical protein
MLRTIQRSLLIIGTALFLAAPVFAQNTESFTFENTGDIADVTIAIDGGTPGQATDAGSYNSTLNGQPVTVFCVDPEHDVSNGQNYASDPYNSIISTKTGTTTLNGGGTYYAGGLANAIVSGGNLNPDAINLSTVSPTYVSAQTRANEIAYLVDTGTTAPALDRPAVQVAIWDIIENGGYSNGSYLAGSNTLGAGGFNYTANSLILTGDKMTVGTVDYYIYEAAQNSNYSANNVDWIQDTTLSGVQYFAYLVPEPGITAFLFSMMIALGFMMYQKKRAAARS